MNKQWEWENSKDLKYLRLPDWEARGVMLAFSSRKEGVSTVPYESLNLSLREGDKQENVLTNRMMLMEALEGDMRNVVCCEQVNGSQVAVVGKMDAGRGAIQYSDAVHGCDAMITNSPGVFLMSFVADCLPLFFFDPIRRVIGLAHCGRNGTLEQIACETVKKMFQVYRCRYSDIEVFMGPGIGKCCNFIDKSTLSRLRELYPHLDNVVSETENGYSWDMASTNRQLLQVQGINPDNITICGLCTSCQKDNFYSMSRDNITGRMAAVLSLIS